MFRLLNTAVCSRATHECTAVQSLAIAFNCMVCIVYSIIDDRHRNRSSNAGNSNALSMRLARMQLENWMTDSSTTINSLSARDAVVTEVNCSRERERHPCGCVLSSYGSVRRALVGSFLQCILARGPNVSIDISSHPRLQPRSFWPCPAFFFRPGSRTNAKSRCGACSHARVAQSRRGDHVTCSKGEFYQQRDTNHFRCTSSWDMISKRRTDQYTYRIVHTICGRAHLNCERERDLARHTCLRDLACLQLIAPTSLTLCICHAHPWLDLCRTLCIGARNNPATGQGSRGGSTHQDSG